jgi:hypothetical protein
MAVRPSPSPVSVLAPWAVTATAAEKSRAGSRVGLGPWAAAAAGCSRWTARCCSRSKATRSGGSGQIAGGLATREPARRERSSTDLATAGADYTAVVVAEAEVVVAAAAVAVGEGLHRDLSAAFWVGTIRTAGGTPAFPWAYLVPGEAGSGYATGQAASWRWPRRHPRADTHWAGHWACTAGHRETVMANLIAGAGPVDPRTVVDSAGNVWWWRTDRQTKRAGAVGC